MPAGRNRCRMRHSCYHSIALGKGYYYSMSIGYLRIIHNAVLHYPKSSYGLPVDDQIRYTCDFIILLNTFFPSRFSRRYKIRRENRGHGVFFQRVFPMCERFSSFAQRRRFGFIEKQFAGGSSFPSGCGRGRHSGAGSLDGGCAALIAGECDALHARASISCSPACVGPSGPRRRNSPGWEMHENIACDLIATPTTASSIGIFGSVDRNFTIANYEPLRVDLSTIADLIGFE